MLGHNQEESWWKVETVLGSGAGGNGASPEVQEQRAGGLPVELWTSRPSDLHGPNSESARLEEEED